MVVLVVLVVVIVLAVVVVRSRSRAGEQPARDTSAPSAPSGDASRPSPPISFANPGIVSQAGATDTGARTFTHLLQVRTRDGNWGNLRDPRSGRPEGLGTVTATVTDLPRTANRLMKQFEGMPLTMRIVFFDGARTDQKLTDDDVFGVVTRGSDVLVRGA